MRLEPALLQHRKRPRDIWNNQIDIVRVPKASILLGGIAASHKVRDLSTVQDSYGPIKRLFESSSSVRLTELGGLLMMSRVHVFLAGHFALCSSLTLYTFYCV